MKKEYYQIPAERLGEGAKLPILKLGDSGEVFYELAEEMCGAIRANNAAGKHTVFICPVGPVGQYPIFVRLVNREKLSLKNCWFINMDEYLTDDGQWIDKDDPDRPGAPHAGGAAGLPRPEEPGPHPRPH